MQPRIAVLDRNAEYSTNRKALKRWAEERLSINRNQDGSLDCLFRYEGTTCTNMGRPLAFNYHVRLGARAKGCLLYTSRSLLPIHPKARVYGAPIISGHVGADAAACMLAVDLAHEERLVAVMDIGTNTELIVGNKHRILAASCPAGPAFEGGAIACGMPALDGAIESVAIADDGTFKLGVIGDLPPEGICGSGLIDVLSELLRTGRMNDMGR